MFQIREIIDLAIQIEKNGERIYRNALQLVSNPSISSLLQKLADEEVQHIEWFSNLKQRINSTIDDPQLEAMGKSILNSILGNQAFSLEDVDFSKIMRIDDLLKVAIEFERDTVLFYEMIRPLIDDAEASDHLNKIIEEENQHIQTFQKILHSGDIGIRKTVTV
ncbi:MAG: ferritin family protein [Deltaproteobacteria bacterium]|nr:ferritin family protein [Deltaproteobacteria bacterium]